MSKFSTSLLASLCVASLFLSSRLLGDEELIISPSSEEWEYTYNPPYMVPTEIPVGLPLRKDLFNILRSKTKPETQFLGSLKAFRNWAIFLGRTVDQEGNSIKNPPYHNDDAVALWLRTQDGWILVEHSFGHSDAYFIAWPEKYGVPRELLGYESK